MLREKVGSVVRPSPFGQKQSLLVAFPFTRKRTVKRQVLKLIVAGKLNKQIAAELDTTEKTIKFHRGNLMRKMGVRVVADLVKLAERARRPGAPDLR